MIPLLITGPWILIGGFRGLRPNGNSATAAQPWWLDPRLQWVHCSIAGVISSNCMNNNWNNINISKLYWHRICYGPFRCIPACFVALDVTHLAQRWRQRLALILRDKCCVEHEISLWVITLSFLNFTKVKVFLFFTLTWFSPLFKWGFFICEITFYFQEILKCGIVWIFKKEN